MRKPPNAYAFTIKYDRKINALFTDIFISEAFDPKLAPVGNQQPKPSAFKAIWDTGATASVITQKVVSILGLQPIDQVKSHTVAGSVKTNIYAVSMLLPNHVKVPNILVAEGKMSEMDVLIGMDIINQGDFAVTNRADMT